MLLFSGPLDAARIDNDAYGSRIHQSLGRGIRPMASGKFIELGRAIRNARENCGMSQESASEALGVTRLNYIQLEKGDQEIKFDQLEKLASLYATSLETFLRALKSKPEESLVAILRLTKGTDAEAGEVEREISKYVRICRKGADLERRLGFLERIGPPCYEFPSPKNRTEAVVQGNLAAIQERQRLELGHNPIQDMSDLINGQRIWATGAKLPESISGLFLKEDAIGFVILVNVKHPRKRKRFSYAHEYAHALMDRDSAAISTTANREQLMEVRANAFAASFLLPTSGIHPFFRSRGKGLSSKHESLVFDYWDIEGCNEVKAMARVTPGSQTVTFHDVSTLADQFGVSYEAAIYRLRTENFINASEMQELLSQSDIASKLSAALAKDAFENGVETEGLRDKELSGQILALVFEAYRRSLVSKSEFIEISNELNLSLSGDFLLELAGLIPH